MALTEAPLDPHHEILEWVRKGYIAAGTTGAPVAGTRTGRLWRIGAAIAAASMPMPRKVATAPHDAFVFDGRLATVAANGTVALDLSVKA